MIYILWDYKIKFEKNKSTIGAMREDLRFGEFEIQFALKTTIR